MEIKGLPKFCQKECKTHGKTEFVLEGRGYYRCKKCRSNRVLERRRKIKLMAVEYKGGSCENCGYNKCIAALEFHHKNPSEKDFAISNKGYTRSWEKVKLELDKCIMLCSNCHHEEHFRQKTIIPA
jgi:5-methylcytosine-specific restriction endonuclease McrA